jgi:hypothetical protein
MGMRLGTILSILSAGRNTVYNNYSSSNAAHDVTKNLRIFQIMKSLHRFAAGLEEREHYLSYR